MSYEQNTSEDQAPVVNHPGVGDDGDVTEVRPEVPSHAVEYAEPEGVQVDVDTEGVPAQVKGPDQDPIETVQVNETSIQVDHVITDTSDPRAVIVPPEGRGDALTPLGRTFADGGKTPEDHFKS